MLESFSFKVADPKACNFINKKKKETRTQVFSCEFYKIFKSIFFTEQLRTTVSDTSTY